MVRRTSHDLLRRVAEANKNTFAQYKEGVYLATTASRTLEDMRHQVTADRLILANHFLQAGHRFVKMRPPQYRSAISRFYYAMYHSMRAVVYFTTGGDDHQEHGVLPKHTPGDFPNCTIWENQLKNARTMRNSADYDPYPDAPGDWRSIARDLGVEAVALVRLAEGYLKQKGCMYL